MEIQSFKTSILLLGVFVMLSSVLVVAEDVLPLPLLPKETHDFLEHCGSKLKPECGKAIEASVYKHYNLAGECC